MKNNKTALIIGGSSSLGISIINKFIEDGFKVLSTYCNSELSNTLNNQINLKLDLNDDKSIFEFADLKEIKNTKIDVLIFISAILPGKSIQEYTFNEIDNVISINFSGIAKVFKVLKNNLIYKSKVIFISSISAERGSYDPIYAASKGALISFMKSISLWSEGKILSNAISPGLIEGSTMFNQMIESRREFHIKNTPSGKLTSINDLSKIIFDITKSNWDNLNGQVISINGGSYV